MRNFSEMLKHVTGGAEADKSQRADDEPSPEKALH
jgi:hypothetical protein